MSACWRRTSLSFIEAASRASELLAARRGRTPGNSNAERARGLMAPETVESPPRCSRSMPARTSNARRLGLQIGFGVLPWDLSRPARLRRKWLGCGSHVSCRRHKAGPLNRLNPCRFMSCLQSNHNHGSVPGIRQDWQAWLQSAAAKDLEVLTPTAAPREHTVDDAGC